MSTAPLEYPKQETLVTAFKDQWPWLLALGVAFLLLGTIGVITAGLFTIASIVLFGVLLVAGCVLQLIESFRAGRLKERWPHIAIALVYGIAGAIMLIDPLDATVALTLVLAILLVAVGVMRIVFALQLRPESGWGWSLAAGLAGAVLGVLILVLWPQASLWVIGLIVAVELIVNGWMFVFLALAARRAARA